MRQVLILKMFIEIHLIETRQEAYSSPGSELALFRALSEHFLVPLLSCLKTLANDAYIRGDWEA